MYKAISTQEVEPSPKLKATHLPLILLHIYLKHLHNKGKLASGEANICSSSSPLMVLILVYATVALFW